MDSEIKPTPSEEEFLKIAYNRFYDLYDEIMDDSFWSKEGWHRFAKVKDGFATYSELLNYEPLKEIVKIVKKTRPPMEAEISSDLFKCVRNIIFHFPFYECWNDVWINKQLVNWHKENLSIDRFLKKYLGRTQVKYRFWEPDKKKMTYLSINFPEVYDNNKIYLKDILSETEGVKFSFILMRKIIDTQIESCVKKP